MTVKVGDRVKVTGVMDDPDPLPVGLEGTVTGIGNPGTPLEQIWVRWDAPRRWLMLLPGDPFTIIESP